MAEAGKEPTAIELERAKRKEQFRSELMKKFAEEAENITLQQIESDSADLKGSWSMIRVDDQKLSILSSACSAVEREMRKVEISVGFCSMKSLHLKLKAEKNKRYLSALEKDKASFVKQLKKKIKLNEKELKSIEEQIKETNKKILCILQPLNEKEVVFEAELIRLQKMMADEEASFNDRHCELEEDQWTIEPQLMAADNKLITSKDSLKFTKDALASCKTAIAMTKQVYLHRLLKLKFDGYVQLVDITDVNILQSICASNVRVGVILKFCVVNEELLELVSITINKEKFTLKHNTLYELLVDDNGTYNIFELSVEEAANLGFKR